MHNVSKIAAVLCLTLNTSMALADKATGAENLIADTAGTAQISVDKNTGYARFIRLAPTKTQNRSLKTQSRRAAVNTDDISLSFLRDYGSAFGITNAYSELSLKSSNTDHMGGKHSVFAQNFKGLPVFAGELRTHFNAAGEMIAVNGNFVANIKVGTTPSLTSAQAEQLAFRKVSQNPAQLITTESLANAQNKTSNLSAKSSTLMIFREGLVKGTPGADYLVYEVEVVNKAGDVREFVYVDAIKGGVVDQITGTHDLEVDRRAFDAEGQPHPGPNYAANPFWVEGQDLPTGNVEADNMINASKETYDFFANSFGRDSFDGIGGTMDAIFNRGDSCPNASWNGVYISFCPGLTTDDVTAHEWGHAYTQETNGLIYQWQSGALNESFSDIWGETVDRLNGRDDTTDPVTPRTDGSCSIYQEGSGDDSVRWLLGEDSTAPGLTGALRDMWNPNCAGDPAKVTDALYHCDTSDFGGVHINSGVPNRAYSLMTDGGTYNGYTVAGIGLTKAAHIHWAAQNMLTPSSNFFDHADALEASCSALEGIDLASLTDGSPSGEMITASDCAVVSDTIAAVEFRVSPVEQCGFEPMLAEAPPLCDGLGDVESFYAADFESGLPAGWTVSSHDVANPATFDSPGWLVTDAIPFGSNGTKAAFAPDLLSGDCAADTEAGAVNMDSPVIELPVGEIPHLAFNHWVSTEATWDGGNLKMSINGGPFVVVPGAAYSFNPYNGALAAGDNPLAGEEAFTGTDGGSLSGSWGQSQVDLYGLASPGDTVQLRFDFGTDGCNGSTGWYVESVEAYSCSTEQPPVCGDGILDLGEMCDDGNSANGDGCSATCQVEDGFVCTAPTEAVDSTNVVADWSFEGGVPNAEWLATSTFGGIDGFPLCGAGNGCPAAGVATSGGWSVWVGGLAGITSSVTQDVMIPSSATEITLNVQAALCDSPDDFIHVLIDGNEIGKVDCSVVDAGFVPRSYAIAPYNDGAMHTLYIGGTASGTNGTHSNFFIDDVVIEDNMAQPAMPSVCTEYVTEVACNVEPVGFDGGIPTSWSVVDNAGTGVVWSNIADSGIAGNGTGGAGDAATANSDAFVFTEFDTELHSNSVDLSGWTGASLEFLVDYRNLANSDFLNLDISTDGGSSWNNLLTWNDSHRAEAVSVDLTHYAGESDVKLRWHYFDPNSGDWDWFAQVDDVSLTCSNEPQALRCDVDSDGVVDRTDVNMILSGRNETPAPGDVRDNDGDGAITMSDARQCMAVCTLPRCASPAPQ